MKHFSEAQWVDFARNFASSKEKLEMEQHIQNECPECRSTLQVWHRVLAIAAGEGDLTPPSDLVRVVKSQFLAIGPAARPAFRLLFDSSLQPAPAGIRGSSAARQYLYETDEYYIDLRLEPGRGSERACLVGQILARRDAHRTGEGITVGVQKGKLPVAETVANRFGEFQLEFDGASDLCVSIGGHEILLPLYVIGGKSLETRGFD